MAHQVETLGLDHHDLPAAKTTDDLARMLSGLRGALGAVVAVNCHRPQHVPRALMGMGAAPVGSRGGQHKRPPLLEVRARARKKHEQKLPAGRQALCA